MVDNPDAPIDDPDSPIRSETSPKINVTQVRVITDDGGEPVFRLPVTEDALRKIYGGDSSMETFLKTREISKDSILQKYWRPACAVLYLLLMLLDYGVRPVINQMYASQFDLAATVQSVKELSDPVQIKALEIAARREIWPPILTDFVHLAFGAILSIAAGTRGWEKVQRNKLPVKD